MKFFTLDTVFQFSWGQVVTAFWQRYPNPNSKHVLSEDVIERWLCGDKLFTKRLIQKKGSIPKWGERIITGCSHAYVVEESMLDLASHTLTTYTRNINLKEISTIDEKCVYTPTGEDGGQHTMCQRFGWVASKVRLSGGMIEKFAFHKFKKSTVKSALGFQFVLNRLFTPDFETEHKSRTEKLKDSAKKAKELAKSSAEKAKLKVLHKSSCDGHTDSKS